AWLRATAPPRGFAPRRRARATRPKIRRRFRPGCNRTARASSTFPERKVLPPPRSLGSGRGADLQALQHLADQQARGAFEHAPADGGNLSARFRLPAILDARAAIGRLQNDPRSAAAGAQRAAAVAVEAQGMRR